MKFWWCFVFLVCFLAIDVNTESSCKTPNGEDALCKPLKLCPILKKAFNSEDEIVQKFVEASTASCAGGGLMVCCGTSGNYTEHLNKDSTTNIPVVTTTESHREYVLKNILPDTSYCGMQHVDDYVHDEEQVSVDEFPWLVLVYTDDKTSKPSANLEPVNPSAAYHNYVLGLINGTRRYLPIVHPNVTNQCTGALISNQYVLTSSDCAMYKSLKVVLGQHNSKKSISCVRTPYGDDCADLSINVTVAEQFRSPNGHFLLLRLMEGISYTDYIRPICLPMDESIRAELSDTIVISGWESYGRADKVVFGAKKKIDYFFDTNDECYLSESPEYMCCTLVEKLDFICKVDNGGPMMYRYRSKNWYVEGIVNVDHCFNTYVDGYRITPDVVEWILENMKL